MLPSSGRRATPRTRSSDVLPAPDAPMIAMRSPGAACSAMRDSTVLPFPYERETFANRKLISTAFDTELGDEALAALERAQPLLAKLGCNEIQQAFAEHDVRAHAVAEEAA